MQNITIDEIFRDENRISANYIIGFKFDDDGYIDLSCEEDTWILHDKKLHKIDEKEEYFNMVKNTLQGTYPMITLPYKIVLHNKYEVCKVLL